MPSEKGKAVMPYVFKYIRSLGTVFVFLQWVMYGHRMGTVWALFGPFVGRVSLDGPVRAMA